jgi:hypothetical protein
MKFVEVDLFGVYVVPISLMMVVAWVAVARGRRARRQSTLGPWLCLQKLALLAVAMEIIANLEGGQDS